MTKEELVQLARDCGGKFHGPRIEHLSISEEDFINRLAPSLMKAQSERIEQLEKECFALAAGQCIVDGGLMGDEYGNQYCALRFK